MAETGSLPFQICCRGHSGCPTARVQAPHAAGTACHHTAAWAGQPAQAASMQGWVMVQVARVHCVAVHQSGGDHRNDCYLEKGERERGHV